jgi:hypothetical protein
MLIRTNYICRACRNNIIQRSEIPYIPAVSADLIGPGSRNIATEADRRITGYHCEFCGIEYHKLPGTHEAGIVELPGRGP